MNEPSAARAPWRLVLVALLIGAGWIAFSSFMRPVQQTCDSSLSSEICMGSIDAALRRGLGPLHPLLLSALAEPGPAARPDQFGHRATITFGMLGVGDPASVRLFFDEGGHWGGVANMGAVELAAWVVGQGLLVAVLVGAGLSRLARHGRVGRRSAGTPTT